MKTDLNSDGVTESYLVRIAGMEADPRAELAELRARVRYIADDLRELLQDLDHLIGPWPHESKSDT